MAALLAAGVGTVAGITLANLELAGIIDAGLGSVAAVSGAAGGAFLGVEKGLSWAARDLKRGYENISHHHGPDSYNPSHSDPSGGLPNKRVKWSSLIASSSVMPTPVAAGDPLALTHTVSRHKFKSGRLKKKKLDLYDDYILRWQRIYPFGVNTTAYPLVGAGILEQQQFNPGWDFAANNFRAANTGRLMLNHVNTCDFSSETTTNIGYMLPYYMVDITCWRTIDVGQTGYSIPVKRLGVNKDGEFFWIPVAGQISDHSNGTASWVVEKGVYPSNEVETDEDRAILNWSDIRCNFYGARYACTKVHVEFVQFKDEKFNLGFHPATDGGFEDLTLPDKQTVKLFWINEIKKHVYNPIDVQMFDRRRVLTRYGYDTFCIEPQSAMSISTNSGAADVPETQSSRLPCATRTYFKRWNRLCNWKWEAPFSNVDITPVNGSAAGSNLETPDYQVDYVASSGAQPVVHPNARMYMIIRCDDYSPVSGTDPYIPASGSGQAYNTSCSFDFMIRNKWTVNHG